jgi:hypothetical protein
VIFDGSNKESVGVALRKRIMGVLLIVSGAVTHRSNVTHRVERDEGIVLHNELDSSGEEMFLVFFRSYCPH